MRANKIQFKKGIFRAYSKKLRALPAIASPEMGDMLGWHMYAEEVEESLGEWLTRGQDDPNYDKTVKMLRERLEDDDRGFFEACRAYRISLLNS